MIKKFTPLNDQVLIKPIEEGEQRRGSIMIASIDSDGPTRLGQVVAVGPGRLSDFGAFVTPTVAVGDTVVIPKIGAQRVIIENEEMWTIPCREIVAIVEYVED